MAPLVEALVIGAGPAGLMAAEELTRAGHKVLVAEAKATPARKFLMAGKSGLNITKNEGFAAFLAAYDCPERLRPMLAEFGPAEVIRWCRALGQEVFTGTSGRVFPVTMKGSPLLRAWLARLGVETRMRWRWVGFEGDGFAFDTPDGRQVLRPRVVVLALGGGQLGAAGVGWRLGAVVGGQGCADDSLAACEHGAFGGVVSPYGAAVWPSGERCGFADRRAARAR